MFDPIAALPLDVTGYRLEPHSIETSGGWVRESTVVRLFGGDHSGVGEDVCYERDEQRTMRADLARLPLVGEWTFGSFSDHLAGLELFPTPPMSAASRHYRRWAFESAALDLALRQAERSLAAMVARRARPVSFVVSLGLGDPPSTAKLDVLRAQVQGLRFKVDFGATWTERTVDMLATLDDSVAVVDLKGQYRGAFQGPPANAALYRKIAERLPYAWIEDPEWNDATARALAEHQERVTWDAILHGTADLDALPFAPRCINVKPSRFGTVREVLAVYEWCAKRGVLTYGGGQFELGPGRSQIQQLASLFHPDAPNDVAPGEYNLAETPAELPRSPLRAPSDAAGFPPG